MTTAAIIVAAGRGLRAGGGLPKQWRDLAGRPVLAHTLDALRAPGLVGPVVLVIHPDDAARAAMFDGVIVVEGGATREASVRAGLEALVPLAPEVVLIHDAARPVLRPEVTRAGDCCAGVHEGAAPAVAVTDALWRGEALVTGTQDREGLWRAQTPQGFRFGPILAAHRAHVGPAADDVAVARAAGMDVAIVAGDEDNIKITGPADFARAARLLQTKGAQMDIRTGNGYDVHRFGPGDHVVLCGVRVPFDRGLQGHSDADVGMHAVTDAIYGALAQGDIGQHFPPSDMQWKGAASEIFLAHACALARSMGFTIMHVDCTLVCEYPKIGPVAQAMRAEMARIMALDVDRVSVKATTTERLGFTGRGEGIAAIATATLVKT
jgi:2-C-methyl-D-erythritol 4-phosphate cytidylyltransferase / 2-C-methyl-D-erythritol 2,4-cyclodiphosphate synthase